jgi:aryl-phospho-beta-D-glucosidase BglC (GH1 family)
VPLVSSQITGKQAVSQMRRGINIGNTLDAPSGETTWGNPAIEEYYFDDYKKAGF